MKKARLRTIPRPMAAQSRNTSEHARGIRFGSGRFGTGDVVSFAVITPPRCRSDPAIVVDRNPERRKLVGGRLT